MRLTIFGMKQLAETGGGGHRGLYAERNAEKGDTWKRGL